MLVIQVIVVKYMYIRYAHIYQKQRCSFFAKKADCRSARHNSTDIDTFWLLGWGLQTSDDAFSFKNNQNSAAADRDEKVWVVDQGDRKKFAYYHTYVSSSSRPLYYDIKYSCNPK